MCVFPQSYLDADSEWDNDVMMDKPGSLLHTSFIFSISIEKFPSSAVMYKDLVHIIATTTHVVLL